MGRPNKEEAERGRDWADGPRRKKWRKKKKETGEDFSWEAWGTQEKFHHAISDY
uniref:Uncharacterized protein n=1 Tax=Oryza sativa subsp. japonica TaxID=39947 RepID=Q69PS2_ORYSJ|nr:hypothetical protein [Oryza sativa Japonica Group]BAD33518.1 hypothetical protein [Oryza sativa Japonica Group]